MDLFHGLQAFSLGMATAVEMLCAFLTVSANEDLFSLPVIPVEINVAINTALDPKFKTNSSLTLFYYKICRSHAK
jgi:threonine/homoserine efflux transporter RhtA